MRRKWTNLALCLSAFVYIYFLLSLLFFSHREAGAASSNFVPFREIKRYLFSENIPVKLAAQNLLGNILLFVPLGIYLRLLFRGRGAAAVILLTALASALAEYIQLRLGLGSCDVDDVILNSLGGAAGSALYSLLRRLTGGGEKLERLIAVLALLGSGLVVIGWVHWGR